MELCQDYLIELFFTHCKRPYYKKYQNIYNAECPVCKEGKSAGRSRRLFYFPQKGYFYCHNCSISWKPLEWVKEVTGLSVAEILKQNKEKSQATNTAKPLVSKQIKPFVLPDLPENAIDLTEQFQVDYFQNNKYVRLAHQCCVNRRLFTAVNSCKKFYISLEDKVHKNRLVIPFFNDTNKVVCYQTRALTKQQSPKYLTKYGEKTIFNIGNVEASIPYVFVFEGPIDSMFVKNGVAMAALSPTEKQQEQLSTLLGYELIYVFDNDKNNEQTHKKIIKYINSGKTVFVWPKEFAHFKDFNEICCKLELDEIPWKFVAKNSLSGQEAILKTKLAFAHSGS